MGVKDGGAPRMTFEEVKAMVDEGRIIEEKKLYDQAKSSALQFRPKYDHHAKEHMAFAPWYPEMNQPGYEHKVHGTEVVPDYRVYDISRTASVSPTIAEYVAKLEQAGLKDPWLRNDLWRVDPYTGMNPKKVVIWDFFKKSLAIGAGLALTHFVIRKAIDTMFPPSHHHTHNWWEDRETPEPNEIRNRIKPVELIYGFCTVTTNPKAARPVKEDYGVEKRVPLQHYKKENDPALVGLN